MAELALTQADGGRQLRIAVISLHASPNAALGKDGNGGLNVYVGEVCRAFSQRGVATDVYTGAGNGKAFTESLAPLSRLVYLPLESGAANKYALLDAVPGFARKVESYAESHSLSYDLVYSHYWLSGAVGALLRSAWGVPWVHTAHTLALVKNRSLAGGAQPEPGIRIDIERQIARSADLLVASTEIEREDLIRQYGAAPSSVTAIAPGVDLQAFAPRPAGQASLTPALAGRFLLFVGRLERLKGVDVALRAFTQVAANHPDVKLAVAGEDSLDSSVDEAQRLRRIAAELGLQERVIFVGSIPHDALANYYSAATACVMPSYSESFGLVALEAQACACPVIASNVPGLASIIRHGVTGYLVDVGEPSGFAARMQELLSDSELRDQMGRRARVLAQRFDWSRTADRLLSTMTEQLTAAQVGVQARARHE